MIYLATKSKFILVLTISAFLTALAGGVLYWIDSGGFISSWTNSATGWGFGIGGIFGFIGLIAGTMVGQYTLMLGKIGLQIQGKPTSEQMSRIQAIQKRLNIASFIDTVALIVALACMATAANW